MTSKSNNQIDMFKKSKPNKIIKMKTDPKSKTPSPMKQSQLKNENIVYQKYQQKNNKKFDLFFISYGTYQQHEISSYQMNKNDDKAIQDGKINESGEQNSKIIEREKRQNFKQQQKLQQINFQNNRKNMNKCCYGKQNGVELVHKQEDEYNPQDQDQTKKQVNFLIKLLKQDSSQGQEKQSQQKEPEESQQAAHDKQEPHEQNGSQWQNQWELQQQFQDLGLQSNSSGYSSNLFEISENSPQQQQQESQEQDSNQQQQQNSQNIRTDQDSQLLTYNSENRIKQKPSNLESILQDDQYNESDISDDQSQQYSSDLFSQDSSIYESSGIQEFEDTSKNKKTIRKYSDQRKVKQNKFISSGFSCSNNEQQQSAEQSQQYSCSRNSKSVIQSYISKLQRQQIRNRQYNKDFKEISYNFKKASKILSNVTNQIRQKHDIILEKCKQKQLKRAISNKRFSERHSQTQDNQKSFKLLAGFSEIIHTALNELSKVSKEYQNINKQRS